MNEELLDLVNDRDEVIGTIKKSEAHAPGKIIRIAHVFIFNSKGELAIQLRSRRVRFAPSHWVTSGSGHVQSGETYEQAGARELQEELGIAVPLRFEGTEFYPDAVNSAHEWLGVLQGRYDGECSINPDDVERVVWRSMTEIQGMIAAGEKFHPEFLFLLEKRYNIHKAR